MPATPLRALLGKARSEHYALPAFNVVDQASMDAVLDAAVLHRSPVVVQVSVRTARFWGPDVIRAGFVARLRHVDAHAALHLDHCEDPEFLMDCLRADWESALFDASTLPFARAVEETRSLVDRAAELGADIEGEFERIARVLDEAPECDAVPVEQCVSFVESTGVSCFSPDLGTRHGMYEGDPEVRYDRARSLATTTPVVLHGGSGLSADCLGRAVRCGVSKVNFSSVLKAEYGAVVTSMADRVAAEPLGLAAALRDRLSIVCGAYMARLGSVGRAA